MFSGRTLQAADFRLICFGTCEDDEAVSILRVALVANHLLVGRAEVVVAAAGTAGVTGWLGGALRAPPTQTHAAPEAR